MTKKSYTKMGYRQPQSRIQQPFTAGNKQQGQAYQGSVRKQQNPHSVDRHTNMMNTGSVIPRNRIATGSADTQQQNRMYTGAGNAYQTERAYAGMGNMQQTGRVVDAAMGSVLNAQDAAQAQKAAEDAVQGKTEASQAAADTGQETQEGAAAAQEPQPAPAEIIQQQHEFEQWRTQETERLEYKEQKLHKQKKQIEQERMQLDIEKRSFLHQQEFEVTRQRNEEQLLDMKRKILEDELYKLAEEKKMFEQKKSFYDKVDSYQADNTLKKPASVHGAIFFAGVNGLGALKKRYKDLLKIYHPDNKCGDTDTIQEINKEYQRLLEKMKGREANGK